MRLGPRGRCVTLRRLTAGREVLQAEELRAEMEVRSAKPIGDCGDRDRFQKTVGRAPVHHLVHLDPGQG